MQRHDIDDGHHPFAVYVCPLCGGPRHFTRSPGRFVQFQCEGCARHYRRCELGPELTCEALQQLPSPAANSPQLQPAAGDEEPVPDEPAAGNPAERAASLRRRAAAWGRELAALGPRPRSVDWAGPWREREQAIAGALAVALDLEKSHDMSDLRPLRFRGR